jgi:HTH-type transcriptional repressor of NAD biosynthesis genes
VAQAADRGGARLTPRFRRGLVVGKFAPLHRGHELVIARALAACDEVIVMSYSKPELPGCPPATRAAWLAALFPTTRRLVVDDAALRAWAAGPREVPPNDASDEDHRRFVARLCVEHLHGFVDAVFTSEDYGDGFARALTRYFQGIDPAAPPVAHVLVDRARQQVPVSGSLIRADVHEHKAWLAPAVYASFVGRVCLLGGESSGKSTLAAELARVTGSAWVPEYGRTLWEEKGGALAFADLRAIGERQVALEDAAAPGAHRWLYCDTSPLTTLFYSHDLFGRADPVLETLAQRPYAATILCAPDFAFVQDGTRREPAFRDRQHAWYRQTLTRAGTPFTEVSGSVAARVAQVQAVLDQSAARGTDRALIQSPSSGSPAVSQSTRPPE